MTDIIAISWRANPALPRVLLHTTNNPVKVPERPRLSENPPIFFQLYLLNYHPDCQRTYNIHKALCSWLAGGVVLSLHVDAC